MENNFYENVEKEFSNLSSEVFESVISEIEVASKFYTNAATKEKDFITVVERKIRNNIIELHSAMESMDITNRESMENVKRLIVKQTCYESIKNGLLKDNGLFKSKSKR